jgi:hypothetical protein
LIVHFLFSLRLPLFHVSPPSSIFPSPQYPSMVPLFHLSPPYSIFSSPQYPIMMHTKRHFGTKHFAFSSTLKATPDIAMEQELVEAFSAMYDANQLDLEALDMALSENPAYVGPHTLSSSFFNLHSSLPALDSTMIPPTLSPPPPSPSIPLFSNPKTLFPLHSLFFSSPLPNHISPSRQSINTAPPNLDPCTPHHQRSILNPANQPRRLPSATPPTSLQPLLLQRSPTRATPYWDLPPQRQQQQPVRTKP